ncbi:MAG: response regulator transcription factor [Bacteroidota bacterium]
MGNPIAILIADDNKLMRQTLKLIIAGIHDTRLVGEATNGEEAIALAKEHLPDIILMDINMTPVNGFEATRKILKDDPSIKIIGLSLHNQPSYAKNMLQLGAKGYISKNSNHNEIIKAIQKVAAGEKYIAPDIEEKL